MPNSVLAAIFLGPLPFGAGLPAVRAALPDAAWETTYRSEFTGRESHVRAKAALDYGGRRMDVDAQTERYDWNLTLTSRTAEKDLKACRVAVDGVRAAVESDLGPLNPREVRSTRTGFVDSRNQERERFEAKFQASFDPQWPENCYITVTLVGWAERPPRAVLAYAESKVIARMDAAEQRRWLGTVAVAPGGTTLPVVCEVSRQTGRALMCRLRDEAAASPEVAHVARRLAAATVFDMSGEDRDDPQTMLVEMPVRLQPE